MAAAAPMTAGRKTFPLMHQNRVQRPRGDQDMALNLAPGVDQQDDQAFNVRVEIGVGDYMLPPVIRRLVRRVAQLHFRRGGALPQCLNLEFLGIKQRLGPAFLGGQCQQGGLIQFGHTFSILWLALRGAGWRVCLTPAGCRPRQLRDREVSWEGSLSQT